MSLSLLSVGIFAAFALGLAVWAFLNTLELKDIIQKTQDRHYDLKMEVSRLNDRLVISRYSDDYAHTQTTMGSTISGWKHNFELKDVVELLLQYDGVDLRRECVTPRTVLVGKEIKP